MKCNKYVRLSTRFLKKWCPKTRMGKVRPDGSVPRHPGADQPGALHRERRGDCAHRPPTERTCPGPELPGRIATTASEMSGLRVWPARSSRSPRTVSPHLSTALGSASDLDRRLPSASGPHAPTSRPLPLSSSQSPCNACGQATQKRGGAARAGVTRAVLTCWTLPQQQARQTAVASTQRRGAKDIAPPPGSARDCCPEPWAKAQKSF